MDFFIYLILTLAAGAALYFGLRWAADKLGSSHMGEAMLAFHDLRDFDAARVHAYMGSAIAYDAERNRIAIWEKTGGARVVDPNGVSEWHSGVLLTQVFHRTTATPMIQLYSRRDRKPFFKVGVVKKPVCEEWRVYLASAFGGRKERDGDFRVLGR